MPWVANTLLNFAEIIANPLLWHQFPGRYSTNIFFPIGVQVPGNIYIRPKSPRPGRTSVNSGSKILPYLPLALIRMK